MLQLQVRSLHWHDNDERGERGALLEDNEVQELRELYVREDRDESRLREMELSIQKEAAQILKERANLQAQKQDLVRDLADSSPKYKDNNPI